MTNKELINILSKYPDKAPVNFCVFSNLTPIRCDIKDNDIMIRQSPHTGLINIMLNLNEYWENDLRDRIMKNK